MTLPLVLSIPHGSDAIPPEIADDFALSPEQVSESADLGTREVFGGIEAAAVMAAGHSRYLVDLNRAPDDLGEQGVVARVDYDGRRVFRRGAEPSRREVLRRVERWWRPYHRRLAEALAGPGVRGLLDCHSMTGVGPMGAPDPGMPRADVCLGNLGGPDGGPLPGGGGLSCPLELMLLFAQCFERAGLSVSLNQPYRGGYITRHYGGSLAPQGRFALQIELNKSRYLDGRGLVLKPRALAQTKAKVAAALGEAARRL